MGRSAAVVSRMWLSGFAIILSDLEQWETIDLRRMWMSW